MNVLVNEHQKILVATSKIALSTSINCIYQIGIKLEITKPTYR